MEEYTKEEIIMASREANTDIMEGRKCFPTEHRELRNIQSGGWNPYEMVQEVRKYKLTVEFLETHGYLKKIKINRNKIGK